MHVVGIDPSLTSLGLAYRDKVSCKTKAHALGHKTLKGFERLAFLRDKVAQYVDDLEPELVVFEGLAMGFNNKNSNNVLNLAELAGILKLLILERGIDILLVPPSNLKMFTTGNGGPDKDKKRVMLAVGNSLNVSFSTSDQYDAAGLMMMGEAYLNSRLLSRDRRHYTRRALAGCAFLPGV